MTAAERKRASRAKLAAQGPRFYAELQLDQRELQLLKVALSQCESSILASAVQKKVAHALQRLVKAKTGVADPQV